MARTLGRLLVGAGSLVAVFAGLRALGHLEWIWQGTLLAMALFYVACHAIPAAVYRWQSMPYTYQVHRNWGPRGFELQNVTYAAYHTVWYNHATHAAFGIEALLWLVVAAHFGGALGALAAVAVLTLQAWSFGEPRFAAVLTAVWTALGWTAARYAQAQPEPAYQVAQLGLVGLGFWRFSGHWVEPIPPGVAGNRVFMPLASLGPDPRLLRALLLGYLSEFSAGLPFRLFNSWMFVTVQKLGFAPRHALPWAEAKELALKIHAEGWSVQPATAAIVRAASP